MTFLISTILCMYVKCQENATQELFKNDLRYWYPIGISFETIKDFLNEGNKPFNIVSESVSMKSPTGRTVVADKIIMVHLSTNPELKYPGVMYLISKGVCTGMLYLDLFENLPKWKEILKTSEEAGDNYFINHKMIHLTFKISPEEGILRINVDVTI